MPGASGKNGTPIQQYNGNNTDAQKWVIQKNADNTYSIISKCNGLALDIGPLKSSIMISNLPVRRGYLTLANLMNGEP